MLEIYCAWCGLYLYSVKCNSEQVGKKSHGICPDCYKRVEAELDETEEILLPAKTLP